MPLTLAQLRQQRGCGIFPNLRKGTLANIAHGRIAPELIWIDGPVPGDATDPLARGVAAPAAQQRRHAFRPRLITLGL